jgi:hypothetical protein
MTITTANNDTIAMLDAYCSPFGGLSARPPQKLADDVPARSRLVVFAQIELDMDWIRVLHWLAGRERVDGINHVGRRGCMSCGPA